VLIQYPKKKNQTNPTSPKNQVLSPNPKKPNRSVLPKGINEADKFSLFFVLTPLPLLNHEILFEELIPVG
jgi:hypothetical protein